MYGECVANTAGLYIYVCMASDTDSYIGIVITKLPVKLDDMLLYDCCTANEAGLYIGSVITEFPMELDDTSMYGQCMANVMNSSNSLNDHSDMSRDSWHKNRGTR